MTCVRDATEEDERQLPRLGGMVGIDVIDDEEDAREFPPEPQQRILN